VPTRDEASACLESGGCTFFSNIVGGIHSLGGVETMKPNPTELPQSINPEAGPRRAGVESHRNLNCAHYDNCLDEAVRRGWQSFSCMKCSLYTMPTAPQMGIESYATQRRAI
jgi:hypothetical protein